MAWTRARAATAPGAAGAGAACLAAGIAAGAAAALGGFFYDGGMRVNVLLLVALFVLLPLLGVALFALAATPPRGRQGLLSGRLARALLGRLPMRGARELAALASGRAGPDVARWLLLEWSQWLGLGFGAGAVATALALVLFTDLAFGWATTLDLSADTVASAAQTLALPWRQLVPAAVPDAALVEASRYFRLREAVPAEVDPALLGRWWPFVLMSMVTYGVLPRMLTLILCRWRLGCACRDAMLADPRVHALLDRLQTPQVESRSPEPEAARAAGAAPPPAAELPAADLWHVVSWAEFPLPDATLLQVAGTGARELHPAGGVRRTAEDRALACALGERLAGADTRAGVLVIAKAWEPPTLELMDFLTALREALPQALPLALLPLAVDGRRAAAPTERQLATWRGALGHNAIVGVALVALRTPRP